MPGIITRRHGNRCLGRSLKSTETMWKEERVPQGCPCGERVPGLPGDGEGHGEQRGFSRIMADPREPTFEEVAHF